MEHLFSAEIFEFSEFDLLRKLFSDEEALMKFYIVFRAVFVMSQKSSFPLASICPLTKFSR